MLYKMNVLIVCEYVIVFLLSLLHVNDCVFRRGMYFFINKLCYLRSLTRGLKFILFFIVIWLRNLHLWAYLTLIHWFFFKNVKISLEIVHQEDYFFQVRYYTLMIKCVTSNRNIWSMTIKSFKMMNIHIKPTGTWVQDFFLFLFYQ